MIYQFIIISMIISGTVTITDNQMEYDWIESCYGEECEGYTPEPEYTDDGISYWKYQFII